MITNDDKKIPRNPKEFTCEKCNYITSSKKDYNKHLLTAKHKIVTNYGTTKPLPYICECGKQYKYRQGLSNHKKKCNYEEHINNADAETNEPIIATASPVEIGTQPNLILELLRENQEFKQLMIDQNKQMQDTQSQLQQSYAHNTELQSQMVEMFKEGKTINNISNTSNKFNLNFFLNNTCKDAMNITDFIGELAVHIDEIEYIGHHGYVNGMTKIIMERLKDMDITKRPIHCTDIKRETMYIKDKDEWCKDTDELTKLRKILTRITMNNYRTVPQWKTAHPKCEEMDTRDYNFCYKMMRVILGDVEEAQVKLDNKIIKTMAKELFIRKES
jgi:hypothetical protein